MSADATPIQTMEARRAEAMRTVKAREDGIRGNAFKQGRAAERAEQEVAISRLFATHQGEIQGISAAHVDEIARLDERWAREEQKHGAGKFWSGVSTGVMAMLAIGSVVAAVYTTQVMNASFDAARESRVQDDVLRTLQRPPTTNEPRSESAP